MNGWALTPSKMSSGTGDQDDPCQMFATILRTLDSASKRRIESLTTIAEKSRHRAPEIVASVQNIFRTAPPERKLNILYVIDSMLKHSGHLYAPLLVRNLPVTFVDTYRGASSQTRKSLLELRRVWADSLPAKVIASIDKAVCEIDPSWPGRLSSRPLPKEVKRKPLVDYEIEDSEEMEPEERASTSAAVGTSQPVDSGLKRPSSGEGSSSSSPELPTAKKPRTCELPNEENGMGGLFGPQDVDMRQMAPVGGLVPFLGPPAGSKASRPMPPVGTIPTERRNQANDPCMMCGVKGHRYHECSAYIRSRAVGSSGGDVPVQQEIRDATDTVVPVAAAPAAATNPPVDVASLHSFMARLSKFGLLKTSGLLPTTPAIPVVAEEKREEEREEKEIPHIVKLNFDRVPEETDDGKPIDWSLSALKRKRPGAIAALYRGKQCTSCGLRLKSGKEFDAHLDMHFDKNKHMAEGEKLPPRRLWLYPFSDWLQSEKYGELDDPAALQLQPQVLEESKEDSSDDDEVTPAGNVEQEESDESQSSQTPAVDVEEEEVTVIQAEERSMEVVEENGKEDVEIQEKEKIEEETVLEVVEQTSDLVAQEPVEEEDDDIIVEEPPVKEFDLVTIEDEEAPADANEAARTDDSEDVVAETTVIFSNSSEFNPDAVMERFDFPIKQEPMDDDEVNELKSLIKAPFVANEITDSPGRASNSSDVIEEPMSPKEVPVAPKPNGLRIRINLADKRNASSQSSAATSPEGSVTSNQGEERTEPIVKTGKELSNLCVIM